MKRACHFTITTLVQQLVFIGTVLANSAPVVTNITVSQRTDGSRMVDIRFDLSDADGDDCDVMVEASSDNGATWTVPINAVTGAVGPMVTPGTGKQIVWNSLADAPAGASFKVRVCADDGQPPTGMVLIPAGEFLMGDTFNEGQFWEGPVHPVYVDAFFMDRYEVTNQQYADALNWARGQGNLITVISGVVYKYNSGTSFGYCDTTTSSQYSRITWNGNSFGVVAGKENHPMVLVSWWGSAAYANWRSGIEGRTSSYDTSTWSCNFAANGYRLPTEAEWEKAARGGVSGHRFPWSDSDTIQHARANYRSSTSIYPPYDTSPTRDLHPTFVVGGLPCTSPVGYFAPNGYGLHDMAGNVWEWVNDWLDYGYYDYSPYNNPHGLGGVPNGDRVMRGGSWYHGPDTSRCAFRGSFASPPNSRFYAKGFRLSLDSE